MSIELIVSSLVIIIVAAITAAVYHWWLDTSIPGMPPGPSGIPFFFNFFQVLANKHRLYDWILETSENYNTRVISARMVFFSPRTINVGDPACAEYVLKDNFNNYIKGPHFCDLAQDFFGNGIFNINGAMWKSQRQVASHMFTVKELRSYIDFYRSHANDVKNILLECQKSGEIVDIQNLFSRCTLDSIGQIAFGVNIDSLHQTGTFSDAFNLAQQAVDLRVFTPLWQYFPFLKCERDMRAAVAVLDQYIFNLIKERKQDPKLPEYNDLLSRYIQLEDENGESYSDKYIRDIVLNIMIAGRDTTAQTLSWCFYLLTQNEAILKTLTEEVESELKGQPPTFDNVKPMKYLQAVIDETLRMYPPVPIDPKMAVNDDVLPGGYTVKAGMIVQWNAWVLGRHPDLWDNPDEMRPKRWFGENGGKMIPKGNQPPFIPFQYGPRTCLGIQFAYLEIKVILCTIIQSGLVMRLQPTPKVVPHSAITISALHGIHMKIEKTN